MHPVRPVRPGVVTAVGCLGVLLVNVDLFVVNVALPDLHDTWHTATLADLSWVLNAYAVVFAALLVPAGRLADRVGHRRAFLAGTLLFTLASAVCAAAPGLGVLVAARAVQAAGAAQLIPASLGLLLSAHPAERRPGAVRLWAAVGGLGAAVGPVLGGLLVEVGWRWVFIINVPIGLAVVVLGPRLLPDPPATDRGRLPDLTGAALLTAAVAVLSLGVVKGGDWGWSSWRTDASLAAAALLFAAFAVRTARHPRPLIDTDLVRNRAFAVAGAASIVFGVAFAGMLLSLSTFLQSVWGWSAVRTGFAIAPGPLVVPVVSIAVGRVAPRTGPGPLVALGGLAFGAGAFWWTQAVDATSSYATTLLPGFLLTGLGVGLMLPTLVAAAASALPASRFATGSGVVTMLRQVGSVLGVAVFVAVVGAGGYVRAWYVMTAASLVAGAVALALPRAGRAEAAAVPDAAAPVTSGALSTADH